MEKTWHNKEGFFKKEEKIKQPVSHGSANCRDANHWMNLLINGECRSCDKEWGLGETKLDF
jgi:hypothetical protein